MVQIGRPPIVSIGFSAGNVLYLIPQIDYLGYVLSLEGGDDDVVSFRKHQSYIK
jgi:hypothetical protein